MSGARHPGGPAAEATPIFAELLAELGVEVGAADPAEDVTELVDRR